MLAVGLLLFVVGVEACVFVLVIEAPSLTSQASSSILIVSKSSSMFQTVFDDFLAICNFISEGNLDIMIGINKLPY